jgi:hypothetical protein
MLKIKLAHIRNMYELCFCIKLQTFFYRVLLRIHLNKQLAYRVNCPVFVRQLENALRCNDCSDRHATSPNKYGYIFIPDKVHDLSGASGRDSWAGRSPVGAGMTGIERFLVASSTIALIDNKVNKRKAYQKCS